MARNYSLVTLYWLIPALNVVQMLSFKGRYSWHGLGVNNKLNIEQIWLAMHLLRCEKAGISLRDGVSQISNE